MLSQAEREGAKVFNKPSALREHPEKLAIMEFQLLGPRWSRATLRRSVPSMPSMATSS
jgi:glutathione synthase/RimK-type ligase-like ATP-grasp enzyme